MRRRELLAWLASASGGAVLAELSGCLPPPRPRVQLVREEFPAARNIVRILWSRPLTQKIAFFSYKPQEFAAPAISEDGQLVYIGSSQKTFYAFNSKTGEIVWERALASPMASQPLYVKSGTIGPEALLIFGDDSGLVSALEAQTGQPRWSYHARGPVQQQPLVQGGLVYLTSNEGRIYALDVKTGAWRWQYERETADAFSIRGHSGVLPIKDRLYVGFPDGYLSCLNIETGEVLWNRQLSGDAARFTDVDGTPMVLGDMLITSCYATGLYALEIKDGSTRWRFDLEAAGPFTVDTKNELIYVSSATQGLFCIDKRGRKLWQQVMSEQGELSAPTLWGRYLLASAAISGLHIADAETGELLQFFDPGQGASARPVTYGNSVYLLSNAGAFFALTAGSG